jgi:SDR family mycofactocin-dependent oxidoreductase
VGRLEGKVAFITGAARGQGRAHALTLAREGADIVAVDIADQIDTVPYDMGRADDLDQTVALVEELDRRAVGIRADVRSQEQLGQAVETALSTFGQIDILLPNAGIFSLGKLWELTDEQWDDMIGVTLTGVWRCVKAVAPHMIERRQGAIVFTCSVNSHEGGIGYGHYAAGKHGVLGLMRSSALELAPYGIRCNSVSPGVIDTDMTNWPGFHEMTGGRPGATREDHVHSCYQFHALAGRSVLPPESVSNAILWLVSDEASDITGVDVPVDAGHVVLNRVNLNPVRG